MLNTATETLEDVDDSKSVEEPKFSIASPLSPDYEGAFANRNPIDLGNPEHEIFDDTYDRQIRDKLEKTDTTPAKRFIPTFKGRITTRGPHSDNNKERDDEYSYQEYLRRKARDERKFIKSEVDDVYADDAEKIESLVNAQNL